MLLTALFYYTDYTNLLSGILYWAFAIFLLEAPLNDGWNNKTMLELAQYMQPHAEMP